MRSVWMVTFLVLGTAACGSDGGGASDAGVIDAPLVSFDQPDLICPGGPSCASAGDGVLRVGGAKRIYTPAITETFTDSDGDSEYDLGEPYVDANANGEFDPYWMFDRRPANAVETDLETRAIVFTQGDLSIGIVYIDTVGLLKGDVDLIQADPRLAAAGLDYVIVGSTHAHDSVDTVGLWGKTTFSSGYIPAFVATLRNAAVEAVVEAANTAVPAQLVIAKTLLLNTPGDSQSRTDRWNQDIRDPIIFDPTLTVARFVRSDAPTTTIATLVNWGNHPEVSAFGEDNLKLSSHYIHYLRSVIEGGLQSGDYFDLDRDLPGLGGVTVFVQGALGGQVGSLHGTQPLDFDGNPVMGLSHFLDQVIGTNVARRALEILTDESEAVSDLPLSFRSAKFHARVENIGLHVAFAVGILAPHPLVGYDPNTPIGPGNYPWVPVRATYLQVGPLALITAPGELHPESWVGGFDGSWTWGWDLLDETKPNAPDLSQAPGAPYLRDVVLSNPGVEYPILAGLAEDSLGYIVPAYNFVLSEVNPYIEEADGDHNEEGYALGPEVEAHLVAPLYKLAGWQSN